MPVVRATDWVTLADALAVRHRVFVGEHGISPDLEYDEYDECDDCDGAAVADGTATAETIHLVSYEGGEASVLPDSAHTSQPTVSGK